MCSEYEDMELNSVAINSLPPASKSKYNRIYDEFQKWNKLKGSTPVTEKVLLAYFSELAQRNKPSSLWAYYSMLKATLRINDDTNISPYSKLTTFLKIKSTGYKPASAKMFTKEEIDKFINEAPDEAWLDVKVSIKSYFTQTIYL